MSETPLITVVTVCLNSGEQLLETVASVLSQECDGWEYLIKDGGSTDGSLDRLPDDGRIRIEVSEDSGIYGAMNDAVALAGGRYINFLNAGDRFPARDTLQVVSEKIRESAVSPDLVYGDFLDERSAKVRRASSSITRKSLFLSGVCHQAQWIRKEVFEELGGFDAAFRLRADQELLLRMAEKGSRFLYIPKVLALYDGKGFTAKPENRAELDREWSTLRRSRYTLSERVRWGAKSAMSMLWLKRLALDTVSRLFPRWLEKRARKGAAGEAAS